MMIGFRRYSSRGPGVALGMENEHLTLPHRNLAQHRTTNRETPEQMSFCSPSRLAAAQESILERRWSQG